MENLEVGSVIFEITNNYGDINISKVKIVGETKTRWKLFNHYVLLKKDLSEYGNRYSRRKYQVSLTDNQKEAFAKCKKKRIAKDLYNKLGKYLKDGNILSDEVENCLKCFFEGNKNGIKELDNG